MNREEYEYELDTIFEAADILIHDAQYTPEDYEAKRVVGAILAMSTLLITRLTRALKIYIYITMTLITMMMQSTRYTKNAKLLLKSAEHH